MGSERKRAGESGRVRRGRRRGGRKKGKAKGKEGESPTG